MLSWLPFNSLPAEKVRSNLLSGSRTDFFVCALLPFFGVGIDLRGFFYYNKCKRLHFGRMARRKAEGQVCGM